MGTLNRTESVFLLKNSYYAQTLKKYGIITLGAVLTAYSISAIYIPNKVVSGGVSGISTILFYLLKIEPGLSYSAINAILLCVAYIFLGKDFVLKTLYGAALSSALVQVFAYVPPMTHDLFLATTLGSVIFGLGIGLTFVEGASTGGTDILGRLLQKVFPQMKIGNVLILIDAFIIALSYLTFRDVDLALYGIMILVFSGASINYLISILNISRLAFIVTEKGKELSELLVSTSTRGITVIKATGAYSGKEKCVLMCALKENELPSFQRKISDIDNEAFVIFSEAQQIVGNGFFVYR